MIRRALAFGALALSACGSSGAVQEQAEDGAKPVDCALGEGSNFGPFCMLETGELDGESLVTIRHPDGGFRRFVVQEDGSGLAAADGADAAQNTLIEGGALLEVVVGTDRYRLPTREYDAGAPKD
ncbi:MAG: hypothetical protein R3D89_14720 [Sphingomonadaceae bacterium]